MNELKQPEQRDRAEDLFDWEQKDFSAGMYKDPPASEIGDNALADVTDCKIFPEWVEGRTGTKLWTSTDLPQLPGRNTYVASKSGYIITKTAGVSFTNDDFESYFIWPDGSHEMIMEVLSSTQVRVYDDTQHSPTTALNPGKMRGPVRSWTFHNTKRKVVLHIDERLFYTNYEILSWTRIVPRSSIDPNNSQSVMRQHGDYVYLFNTNGLFKINLGITVPDVILTNGIAPTRTITENTSTTELTYGRRYLFDPVVLDGNGERDRTSNTIIHEGAVQQPDPENDNKDYMEVWQNFEFGSSTGTYEKLVCATTPFTFTQWATRLTSSSTFDININGLGVRGMSIIATSRFLSNPSLGFDGIAEEIQQALRNSFPEAPDIQVLWVTDHFEIISAQTGGSTISYITPAGIPSFDISAYMNGGAGFGTITDVSLSASVGPLSLPVGSENATHYGVFSTQNIGDATNSADNYIWNADIPVAKAFTASRSNATGIITANDGYFQQYDLGETITFDNGSTDTIVEYLSETQVQGTAGLGTISSAGAGIGATTIKKLSQVNTTVTISVGASFSAADVGKVIHWADGYTSTIRSYTSATEVEVWEDAVHAIQGAVMDITGRSFNDVTTETTLENRIRDWSLTHRLFAPLPSTDLGAVVPGFVFGANHATSTLYYSNVAFGKDYLIGTYNVAYQFEVLDDWVTALEQFPDLLVIYCSKSTKRIPINVSNTVTIPSLNYSITTISGVTEVDSEVGCLDYGSIRNIEAGQQILVTSEPGVRIFNGYQYSQNLAIDSKGRGHILKDLQLLQNAVASSYDPVDGYILWGTDEDV